MTSMQLVFLALIFLLVFGSALAASRLLNADRLRGRLRQMIDDGAHDEQAAPVWVGKLLRVTGPFAKLSLPEEGWEKSSLRSRFMHAGLRDPSAPMIFFGAKTLLAVVLPAFAYILVGLKGVQLKGNAVLVLLFFCAAIGYYLPNFVLAQLVKYRQRAIFENFPDALDLMTVSIEAGLAVDAALNKVAEEMRLKSSTLSEELRLVTLELRAGSGRDRALRNLALRTGVEDVDTLVAMMIQAERFGTSMADSLRVHSDTLRTKRRLRAEEAAAKIPLKLLFPLVFTIFPSLLLVLLGPAYIQITRALTGIASGGQ